MPLSAKRNFRQKTSATAHERRVPFDMHKILPLVLLPLFACNSRVDGTSEGVQAWHMRHAPLVFGTLVSAERAGCTVTETTGNDVIRYEYDASGALVHEDRDRLVVDLGWRDGCLVSTDVVFKSGAKHVEASCRDGWPVRQTTENSDGTLVSRFENEVEDGRLVRRVETRDDDFQGVLDFDWEDGQLVQVRGDGYPDTVLTWDGDRLDTFEQSGALIRWDYDAQGRRTVQYADDVEVLAWTYGDADDPRPLAMEADGLTTAYAYDCD